MTNRTYQPQPEECTVSGCARSARTHCYCDLHYLRWRRTGSTELLQRQRLRKSCTVEDCDNDRRSNGLCSKHLQRLRKHGHLALRETVTGSDHHSWKGDDVKYRAVHKRLGPASNHPCIDCGNVAAQWSYDHSDIHEKLEPQKGLPYSTDPSYYQPRCAPCHKTFDTQRLAS